MFDPLDLYTAEEERFPKHALALEEGFEVRNADLEPCCSQSDLDGVDENESDSESVLLDVLDLPCVQLASSKSILCVLLLLEPNCQVNFVAQDKQLSVEQICKEKNISSDCLHELVRYYNEVWENQNLNTALKICSRIPPLVRRLGSLMLKYYTTVLKHFEESSDHLRDDIIRQVSLRIAEGCGRNAQPAMSRKFTYERLPNPVEIYEPSLTADNLGWKTWGASFILSQKLIDLLPDFRFASKPRVLELGSGTGLAGITWLCKWVELYGDDGVEMFLTDLPVIVPNLQKNIEVNKLENVATVSALDWTDPNEFVSRYTDRRFDVIIVSDPIYSPDHPRLVVSMIKKFLSSQGKCFLEIPIRPKYAVERKCLRQLLKDNNLCIIKEEVDQGMEDWGMVDYMYLEITRRRKDNLC